MEKFPVSKNGAFFGYADMRQIKANPELKIIKPGDDVKKEKPAPASEPTTTDDDPAEAGKADGADGGANPKDVRKQAKDDGANKKQTKK